MGLDNGKWRTYKEVGACLNVSIEWVRQLLLPAKVALRSILKDQVPWPAPEGKPSYSLESEPPLIKSSCTRVRIGAGAVVVDDIPEGVLAYGVPARVKNR